MSQIQDAKTLVQAHYSALAHATPSTVVQILSERMNDEALWRGYHPYNLQTGPAGAALFWKAFLTSFSAVQRREVIFFAV